MTQISTCQLAMNVVWPKPAAVEVAIDDEAWNRYQISKMQPLWHPAGCSEYVFENPALCIMLLWSADKYGADLTRRMRWNAESICQGMEVENPVEFLLSEFVVEVCKYVATAVEPDQRKRHMAQMSEGLAKAVLSGLKAPGAPKRLVKWREESKDQVFARMRESRRGEGM